MIGLQLVLNIGEPQNDRIASGFKCCNVQLTRGSTLLWHLGDAREVQQGSLHVTHVLRQIGHVLYIPHSDLLILACLLCPSCPVALAERGKNRFGLTISVGPRQRGA